MIRTRERAPSEGPTPPAGSHPTAPAPDPGRGKATQETVPALELTGIAHRFANSWILRGCTLTLAPGEALALIGRNGAGKTTLLRIVATLLRPSRGEGRIFGHELLREPNAVREQVGMMGVAPALYEDLTAEENLRFACRMRGQPADRARILRVLEEVALGAHAGARVRSFSSGMRKRVSLARVLLSPPRLLLLDEPYASIDEEGTGLVNSLVERVKDAGGAVLLTTHDLPRASGAVERVARIERGVLVEEPLTVLGEEAPLPSGNGTRAATPLTCR
jgi:heme exporter protein A